MMCNINRNLSYLPNIKSGCVNSYPYFLKFWITSPIHRGIWDDLLQWHTHNAIDSAAYSMIPTKKKKAFEIEENFGLKIVSVEEGEGTIAVYVYGYLEENLTMFYMTL